NDRRPLAKGRESIRNVGEPLAWCRTWLWLQVGDGRSRTLCGRCPGFPVGSRPSQSIPAFGSSGGSFGDDPLKTLDGDRSEVPHDRLVYHEPECTSEEQPC